MLSLVNHMVRWRLHVGMYDLLYEELSFLRFLTLGGVGVHIAAGADGRIGLLNGRLRCAQGLVLDLLNELELGALLPCKLLGRRVFVLQTCIWAGCQ